MNLATYIHFKAEFVTLHRLEVPIPATTPPAQPSTIGLTPSCWERLSLKENMANRLEASLFLVTLQQRNNVERTDQIGILIK